MDFSDQTMHHSTMRLQTTVPFTVNSCFPFFFTMIVFAYAENSFLLLDQKIVYRLKQYHLIPSAQISFFFPCFPFAFIHTFYHHHILIAKNLYFRSLCCNFMVFSIHIHSISHFRIRHFVHTFFKFSYAVS